MQNSNSLIKILNKKNIKYYLVFQNKLRYIIKFNKLTPPHSLRSSFSRILDIKFNALAPILNVISWLFFFAIKSC